MTVELYQQRMIYRNGWAMVTETEAAANLFGLNINIWLQQSSHCTLSSFNASSPTCIDILLSRNHGISVFWNCAVSNRRTQETNSKSVQWIYLICVWPNVWQTIKEADLCIVVWSNIIINLFWSCLRLYR